MVGHLPVDQAARGKVRGPWGIGAVGVFSLMHAASLAACSSFVFNNEEAPQS